MKSLNIFFNEVKNLHKIYGFTRSIFFIVMISVSCFPLLLPANQIKNIAPIITSIVLSINILQILPAMLKQEIENGYWEWLLTLISTERLLVIKFFSIIFSVIVALLPILLILLILSGYNNIEIIFLTFSTIFLVFQLSGMALLAICIQAYFHTNTEFILAAITPLVLPYLIIFGILMGELKLELLMLDLGITLFTIPIYILMSNYLTKNIYNF